MTSVWDKYWPTLYSGRDEPRSYPGSAMTYVRAGMYLSGPGLVEEWGCATTWGRQFIGAPYRGVDGAPSKWVDEVADLLTYRSVVPKVLMRHVLEHNWEWRRILNNMLDSFTDRAVLILFIKPGKLDVNRSFANMEWEQESPPGLQLDEESLMATLSRPGIQVHREVVEGTGTPPFGYEEMFFLRKEPSMAELVELAPKAIPDHCIIKDTPDQEGVCGQEVYERLKTTYTWGSGQKFEFAFGMCKDHHDTLVERLNSDDFSFSAYRVG